MCAKQIYETEVAAPIVAWLRAGGWDVYQEVRAYGSQADIVAVQNKIVWCVETKTRTSADVLEQAAGWAAWANYISIGVPFDGYHFVRRAFMPFVDEHGIGILKVRLGEAAWATDTRNPGYLVEHVLKPRLHRKSFAKKLLQHLYDEQRDYCQAGSMSGGAWSPYKATCEYLSAVVEQHPGCTLREAICGPKGPDGATLWPGVRHHYRSDSTAISSLRQWIERGKVPRVRLERDGRILRLYPAEPSHGQ